MVKSKKRKRSHSRDRLAELEDKVSQIFELLTQSEVRPRASPASFVLNSPRTTHVGDQGSRIRAESGDLSAEVVYDQLSEIDDRPGPFSGVYVIARSVFEKYRRHDRHNRFREHILTFLLSFPVAVSIPSVGNGEDQSPPDDFDGVENGSTSKVASEKVNLLTQELFGSDLQEREIPSWNELVSKRWRDLTRKGLSKEEREVLTKKYAPSEATAFLQSPRLNPECIAGLKSNSIVKRDEYLARNQDQLGIALCALGEAFSELLGPSVQSSLSQEARSAVAKISEGAKILADLFYRLSSSRRAQITPALNLSAKNTADAIPPDEFLFGASFGEEIKKTSALIKSSRDIVKATSTIPRKTQQPIKLATQPGPSRSGNDRAPVRSFRPATSRRAGAASSNRRASHRSTSHSRSHSRKR